MLYCSLVDTSRTFQPLKKQSHPQPLFISCLILFLLYFFEAAEAAFCLCKAGESRCFGFQPEEAEAKLDILAVFCFCFEEPLLFLLLLPDDEEDEIDEVEDGERDGDGGGEW